MGKALGSACADRTGSLDGALGAPCRSWPVRWSCAWLLAALVGCGGNYALESGGAGGYGSPTDVSAPKFASDVTSKQDAAAKGDGAGSLEAGDDQADAAQGAEASGANGDGSGAYGDGSGDNGGSAADAGSPAADLPVGSGSCGKAKPCQVDADCPGVQCSVAACDGGCCANTAAVTGVNCDDANACTEGDKCGPGGCSGTPKNCDDGKVCTVDSCDPAKGACAAALAPGSCLIGGNCLADGQGSQANECKVCDPAKSTDSWSLAPTCCAQNADCPKGGACDVPSCDLATNKCGFQQAIGCCVSDQDCSDGNACTMDSCDVGQGTCAYKVVECLEPSPCQAATCDGKSGECKATTKAGWCLIDGSCQSQGAQNQANACQTCDSLAVQDQWTTATGTGCNDGNPCTFNDMCGQAAKCAGTAQPGCCLNDGDCPLSTSPCAVNACDAALGLCMPKPKPGCCTSGTCCDVAAKTIKPAQSVCGSAPLSTQYQCSGQSVQQREITAGCTGKSGDGCSTAPADQVTSAWKTIKSCATGTKCTATGTAVMPTCTTTTPAGSCGSSCGGKSSTGPCFCDSICAGAGDCCADFKAICSCTSGTCCDTASGLVKSKGSACVGSAAQYQCVGKDLQKRIEAGSCDASGKCGSSATPTWGAWTKVKTCTASQNCGVLPNLSAGDCYAIPAGSCVGSCGTLGKGDCYCDAMCSQLGDCCADYAKAGCAGVTACGGSAPKSCKGMCGKQSAGLCWCDTSCEIIGDCCPDKMLCACN